MKRKFDGKQNNKNKKKVKTSNAENDKNDTVKAEALDIKTLREGMLLLGCVIEIRSNSFLMSLPGCLTGCVPFTNISRRFTDELRSSMEDTDDLGDTSLESVIEVGAVFPCKVLQITYKNQLKKPIITLSIDPKDVNEDLRLQSLYLKMALYAAVESVEDHGYVMDVGVKGVQGFLPFSTSHDIKSLKVGQVIPTIVKKLPSLKTGNVAWLSKMSYEETFPEIEDETMKLSSILPGANVTAYVTNVKHPFLYLKSMNFEACANTVSLGSSNQNLTEGMKVSGIVLYVHPISHMIYLLMSPKPTPLTFQTFFNLKKYDMLKNVKYEFGWHSKLLFKIHKGSFGYIKKLELPEKGLFSQESLLKTPLVPKARVIFLHYMDNLVQISFKESILNLDIKRLEDVEVGDIFEATVKKHISNGMFVQVCPGLRGFVRTLFISDALVTMAEKLHPAESKVKCRVLSKNDQFGLGLTCKESLLNLSESDVVKSYEILKIGRSYKGVIVQKKDTHILVLFFNDIKGVVPKDKVPPSSVLYVGQTVSCEVLVCNPAKRKLTLSLMGRTKTLKSETFKKAIKAPMNGTAISSIPDIFEPVKTHKAIIVKITGHQLNIIVEGTFKGRIHVSVLGSFEEYSLPLMEFKTGNALKVHVLGQYDKKGRTFLPITHRITKCYLECALEYPPPLPLEKKFRSGMAVTGFVQKKFDTFANVWLSPVCIGTLEYLHFSENPKVLRKLKKRLSLGLSLNLTVLQVMGKMQSREGRCRIMLTKLENKLIKAGTNVVGLVECASLEEGLVLQLPHGYQGTVSLTDLQDVYAPVNRILLKCTNLRYILCHVLEVDHANKTCSLSLRQSRFCRTKVNSSYFCPEVTVEDVKEGKHFKGFVKRASDNLITVNFGRMLDGRVSVHKCSTLGCALCKLTHTALQKYPAGSVIEVVVEGLSTRKKNPYILSLPELNDLESTQPSRLKVTQDINWDDV